MDSGSDCGHSGRSLSPVDGQTAAHMDPSELLPSITEDRSCDETATSKDKMKKGRWQSLKKIRSRMDITLPDLHRNSTPEVDQDGGHQVTSSSESRSSACARKLTKKKSGVFKSLDRTKSELQAVEKARLSTNLGLDHHAIESIEKSVKYRRQDEKVYSIGKYGVGKMVSIFSRKPSPRPQTMCFEFPSMALTHMHVLKLIRGLISPFPAAKITEIQFVDRNVTHGSRGLENRWILTIDSKEALEYAISSGLPLFNRIVTIRSYDDLIGEEYDNFIKHVRHQKYLNPESKKAKE